ncbi:hypothetical protein [Massilia aerilata]|uniref:Outer membrane protein beta-barrel domain-containing protein n=1 Tax=Massilia aerilata TaxID=453817 RepID=A0ABW0RX49_9BURK
MRVRKALPVIPFVLGTIVCAAAQAQSDPPETQFTVGVKLWHAGWLSYIPANYSGMTANGTPAIGDSVNATEGTEHTDFLPSLQIRRGKFFASFSHGSFSSDFRVSTSPIILPTGQTLITSRSDHFSRRESDLNLGYNVTPELSLVVGYKDATETRDTILGVAPQSMPLVKTTAKGFLFGAAANFAVVDKLRFYAQAAYGPARLKLRFADPGLGSFSTNGRYLIGELGLNYPVYIRPNGFGIATASVGYRTQTIKTNSYASIFQESRELRDVRDGVILSINYTM